MTSNAKRAYCFADEFRARGRTVVMGGVHPTMVPEEALTHSDAVVVGEAEGVWEQLLEDVESDRLQSMYHRTTPSLDRYIPTRHRRIPGSWFNIAPAITTRGCPYDCDFCSVLSVFGRKLRHHPIEHVMAASRASGTRRIVFLDDNIVGDRAYARELFQRLKPPKVSWVGQASISLADDRKLVQFAADSGCAGLLVGLESVSHGERARLRKLSTNSRKLEEGIRTIRKTGIQFHPSFVFGFDTDTTDVFRSTLQFLEHNHIGTADFFTLTPYPGTDLYRRLESEGRLLSRDWNKYDAITSTFSPLHMSPQELQNGLAWTKKQFLRIAGIAGRLSHNLTHAGAFLAANLGYRKSFRRHLRAGKYGAGQTVRSFVAPVESSNHETDTQSR